MNCKRAWEESVLAFSSYWWWPAVFVIPWLPTASLQHLPMLPQGILPFVCVLTSRVLHGPTLLQDALILINFINNSYINYKNLSKWGHILRFRVVRNLGTPFNSVQKVTRTTHDVSGGGGCQYLVTNWRDDHVVMSGERW